MKKWKKWFGASDASSKVIAACLLGVVVMVGWLVSPAVAAIIEDFRCGTLYVNRTSTLVGDVTITGGLAVTGSTTADMTGDDINANGTEADTLGINFPAAQLTNTLTFVVAPATPIVDGSSQTVDWDVQNDSNETVTAMRDVLTVDDNTTNTEDTAWEKWLEKAGVLTKILDADALGLAVVGNVAGTTHGGITEANLVDKSAVEAIGGVWTHSADLKISGTADFHAADDVFIVDDTYVGGNLVVTGNVTAASLVTTTDAVAGDWYVPSNSYVGLALVVTNDVTLGSGAASTVSVDSAVWDITGAGAASGFTTISATTSIGAPDLSATDDLTVTDDATVGGMFRITPTALTVTNAQPITFTDSAYILTVSGSANNYTNTPVIANPTTAGDIVILHVLAASSNLCAIADSGNMLLSAAWEGGDNDVLVLQAITTSLWAEISRSDN